MIAASSMWAGWEPTWVPLSRVRRMVPSCCLGYYGNSGITSAVGGVTLFLEYAEEVIAVIFPSTIYVDGVLRWQWCVRW